ncbi:adenosylcobinamide-GDP ribazoletransferase [Paucibacter sp. O1-1]|nr:adenosylcobinamide-GDP ribazoletransferase [Paucibacter sp. O1-1]MDA3825998.1 adenosylcobinamide-GDP ribazoletransferase [Paucibacter sp. O1-1]
MKRQITLFFTALQFYTRIPVPKWVGYQPENLSAATAYLPFIGWIVGQISGLPGWVDCILQTLPWAYYFQ